MYHIVTIVVHANSIVFMDIMDTGYTVTFPSRDPMAECAFLCRASGWFDRWSFGNLWNHNHPPHIGRVHPDWALQSNEIGHTRPWSCCLKDASTKLVQKTTWNDKQKTLSKCDSFLILFTFIYIQNQMAGGWPCVCGECINPESTPQIRGMTKASGGTLKGCHMLPLCRCQVQFWFVHLSSKSKCE